jgi:hypothetical protein
LRLLLLLLRLLRLPCAAEGVRWPLPLGGVVVMAGGGPLCAELDMVPSRVRGEVVGIAHQRYEVCDREMSL